MKKILTILLCFSLCLSLCGCSVKTKGLQKGLESIISAIGFEKQKDTFYIYLEAVTVNSEDPEADKEISLIKGKGKSLNTAFYNASQKTVRSFMFSHCATAVIGSGITPKCFREICRFLYSKKDINLSLRFFHTENAEKLLSCKPVSSITVGYDLIDALERHTSYSGTEYQSRFYQIESARKKAVNIFAIPHFSVEKEAFFNNGLTVFKNDEAVLNLSNEEALIYALLTDNQQKGNVFLNGFEYYMKASKLKRDFSYKDTLNITLTLTLEAEAMESTEIVSIAESLLEKSKLSGADIFMLGNTLYKKNRKLWNEISHDYYNIYKNSKTTVVVK